MPLRATEQLVCTELYYIVQCGTYCMMKWKWFVIVLGFIIKQQGCGACRTTSIFLFVHNIYDSKSYLQFYHRLDRPIQ